MGSPSRKDAHDQPFFSPFNYWPMRLMIEPSWRQGVAFAFVPLLIVILGVEYLLGMSATTIMISFVALSVLYAVIVLLIFVRR